MITFDEETIAAISTAYGAAAISVIRVSGKKSQKIRDKIFISRSKISPRKLIFGKIIDSKGNEIDDVLLTTFIDPNSYTGEDLIEIHCHGGIFITKKVYEIVLEAGARPAKEGEFTARAFYNGKMDLTQAEGVMDIINAKTDLSHVSAKSQLSGNISKIVNDIKEGLLKNLAHIEAYIDFPDEDIEPNTNIEILSKLENIEVTINDLIETEKFGNILRNGALCIIIGVPNVGKSSLLNKILGYDRAIVSSQEGTTRDFIEEIINLDGIPLRITDTAGIRQTDEKIEQRGIERTQKLLNNANIILEVYDITKGKERQKIDYGKLDEQYIIDKVIKVLNKDDLKSYNKDWNDNYDKYVKTSCNRDNGVENLLETIKDRILFLSNNKDNILGENVIAVNKRHQTHLKSALNFLKLAIKNLKTNQDLEIVALDIRSTIDELESIIGKIDTEDVLGEIFGSFCIGK